MRSTVKSRSLALLVALAGAFSSAYANSSYTTHSCNVPTVPNTLTVECAGNTATLGAWANTYRTTNTRLESATPIDWGTEYGVGVQNRDANSATSSDRDSGETTIPEHAIDNQDRYEMVSLDFGSTPVILSQLTLGWSMYDADISVLAYTGAGTPTLSLNRWSNLLGTGWTLIGNYDVNAGANATDDINVAINTGNVSASYWLIGAYNPVFGTSATNGGVVDVGTGQYDYFKLAGIACSVETPPTPSAGVPEPASLALAGAGLAGLLGARRRRGTRKAA